MVLVTANVRTPRRAKFLRELSEPWPVTESSDFELDVLAKTPGWFF